ncbi:Nudix hydrolase 15 [Hibiscus syriacus]|uniref:RING-type E3 ubiquitin transferase n=1 Tax=Hibiscus syriacus TaxID=106335 RepID=A0A6A2WWI2_HIBSY|nr:E3 ubiquitin-protein ligase ATL41-like [Hibiscus syriacus]KAE8659680.1 Nudix hydrolase 15 [Hibiscus syriacus]
MGSDDDDNRGFGVSRKLIVAAIASLLGVVIIIILLHLYTRYLLRRQERRRRAALNLPRTRIAAFYETSIMNPPKSGLDPLVLATLPMFTYKLTTSQVDDHDESMECSVCLGTITEESTVRLLPNCKHMFHVECIDTWLGSHTTCPICRTEAEPTVQAAEDKELCSRVQPTAPTLMESASIGAAQEGKEGGASGSGSGSRSRFGSFRRMLGGERSSTRFQSCRDEIIGTQDLERQ